MIFFRKLHSLFTHQSQIAFIFVVDDVDVPCATFYASNKLYNEHIAYFSVFLIFIS